MFENLKLNQDQIDAIFSAYQAGGEETLQEMLMNLPLTQEQLNSLFEGESFLNLLSKETLAEVAEKLTEQKKAN